METKHDLSSGTAKINLTELKSALLFGGRHAQNECERALSDLQNSRTLRERLYATRNLNEASTALAKISTSLYYLDEAKKRDEIVIDKEE
jgi:hypothetical protein